MAQQQPTVQDPLDMDQNDFIKVIEKLFEQEHEYTRISKEDFINNYLVIIEAYIKGRGYNPLSESIRGFMECAVDNIMRAKKEQ